MESAIGKQVYYFQSAQGVCPDRRASARLASFCLRVPGFSEIDIDPVVPIDSNINGLLDFYEWDDCLG